MTGGDLLKLVSDFQDYYDYLFDNQSEPVYRRMYSECNPRGKALNIIKGIGVPTIELGAVSKFSIYTPKLVVYTNQMGHLGSGKQIVNTIEAYNNFGNSLACPFVEDTAGISLKFLQVGKRRYQLVMQNENLAELKHGRVIKCTRISDEYNFNIRLPIFSIDYIAYSGTMLAIDFNEVQSLSSLGVMLMKPEEVIYEVKEAMRNYKIGYGGC